MPPFVALMVWLILLLGLLFLDPANSGNSSPALWIPVAWMFIMASRLPSQWFGEQMGQAAEALQDGNPVDRIVYLILIALALWVLKSRSFNWKIFLTQNLALTLLLAFALLSVAWSDFPFVSLKRWVRDLGDYVMVLVLLSDADPLDAVRISIRRACYIGISLSVVLIKYFPQSGIHYSVWTGAPEYVGVATSKNTLGALTLISGLYFFWDTVTRWSAWKDPIGRRGLFVNVAFLAMTLWLLNMCNSATSRVCLILGCFIVSLAYVNRFRRNPIWLKVLLPAIFLSYLCVGVGLGLNDTMAEAVGRDPSFTGRTTIWNAVLNADTNPVIGTGYDSFWLGSRLISVWKDTGDGINEAHNGFLEVYLNLGLIGVGILIFFIVSVYRQVCRGLDSATPLGAFGAGVWMIMLFQSITEAVFKSGILWMMFLIAGLAVQHPEEEAVEDADTEGYDVQEYTNEMFEARQGIVG